MDAIANVKTAHGKRYLGQFCKHFAHKLPVVLADDNTSGQVSFDAGTCLLAANDDGLVLTVCAQAAEDVARLQSVVDRHLVRFAFREDLQMAWQAA
jgi:hypothetical protein